MTTNTTPPLVDPADLAEIKRLLRARRLAKDGVTRQPRKHERLAADIIEQLERELAEAHASEDAMGQKLNTLVKSLRPGAEIPTCGCSYDRASDVCLHHSPALEKATRELAEARGHVRHLSECLVTELGEVADEDDCADEDLADMLGKDYARQVIACRLRIRSARTYLERNPE